MGTNLLTAELITATAITTAVNTLGFLGTSRETYLGWKLAMLGKCRLVLPEASRV